MLCGRSAGFVLLHHGMILGLNLSRCRMEIAKKRKAGKRNGSYPQKVCK